MKDRIQRLGRVAEILRERNGASIRELSGYLKVSEMTIRRDLEQLRRDNIISLVHGAAIFKTDPAQQRDYHLSLEKSVSNTEKERIGKAAARMVVPGDIIIIDIGTTTECIVRHIPMDHPITALCFTMNALTEICKKNIENLIMGGGYYHGNTQLFESVETISLIQRIRATKLFLSAAGISRELGLTCANQYEVSVKQACINSSLQKILTADSRKFGCIRPAYFASLDKIDTVITDDNIEDSWVKIMEDMGITVEVV
ncbi:MAG: DeoR/GlpR family DNA-binding transcription regulator [Treponema sp.]|nr:DeoR/GlpR family DNA-binding transcription regulator [Treponema sp.]